MKTPHHIAVLLSQQKVCARPGEGYEPLFGYIKAIESLSTPPAPRRLRDRYAVTNSDPAKLHCEAAYIDVVRT